MPAFILSPMESADFNAAAELWNAIANAGEILYRPISAEQFPFQGNGMLAFAAKVDGKLIGWIHGASKQRFLNGENSSNTPAYLTAVLVDSRYRRQGIGRALLNALMDAFRAEGEKHACVLWR